MAPRPLAERVLLALQARPRPPLRLEVPDDAAGEAVRTGRLPMGLGRPPASREVFRDVYYDTPDNILQARNMVCRVRWTADARRVLTVRWDRGDGTTPREDADVTGLGDQKLRDALAAAGLLRAVADPSRLAPVLDVQIDRHVRLARWLGWPSPCLRLAVDRARVVRGDQTVEFTDVTVSSLPGIGPTAEQLVSALSGRYDLRPTLVGAFQRARQAFEALETDTLTSALHQPRECAVILVRDGDLGLHRQDGRLGVLWTRGSGEAACRDVLERTFDSSQAQVRHLGRAPERAWRPPLEVWMARRLPQRVASDPDIEWISLARAIEIAGTPLLRDTRTLSALHVAAQSDLMRERRLAAVPGAIRADIPGLDSRAHRFLDADLSQLDFNARVLELARDATIPVADRVGYLSIAASNLDEFFMVRVAALKHAVGRSSARAEADGASAARLDAVRLRARALQQQMAEALTESLLPALAGIGTHIRHWKDLTPLQKDVASRRFHEEVRPRLVPLAATPNHPFPWIGNIELALMVMLRHPDTSRTYFATVSLPPLLPRFLAVDDAGTWLPIEALVCAHASSLFAGVDIVRAHTFRVTRSGDVDYGETESTDALQLVADAIEHRPYQPVVRLEVERTMPADMRATLIQEFRFERPDRVSDLEEGDVIAVDGLAALRGLRDIASGLSCRVPLRARRPFPPDASVFETVRRDDVLVHFPYDSFEHSVLRFLNDSSNDPAVESIVITLYRTGDCSPVVDALLAARAAGKTVVVLVELKARFDEARNIESARALRAAGVHIVYGVTEMKLHSKVLLVLRRDSDALRRYAFVGSGNFNPFTARLYTDVGLFTAREDIGAELAALIDSLTGLAGQPSFDELLVSPANMPARLVALIRREIDHAAQGRPAGIRAKLNGLDDPEIVEALYEASQAGVEVDLSIRGICTLRPGVPGLSDRIRVICVLGEFLEHARIIHVVNGGRAEYFLGSADWRERNLRRRVEVLTPVRHPAHRARLNHLLNVELDDPNTWRLMPDGQWIRRGTAGAASGTQRRLLTELDEEWASVMAPARSVEAAIEADRLPAARGAAEVHRDGRPSGKLRMDGSNPH